MKLRIMMLLALCLLLVNSVFAGTRLEVLYPYNMEDKSIHTVNAGSTVPLYLNLSSFDIPHEQKARITVLLPEGFSALPGKGWQIAGQRAAADWVLPADFGQSFDLLYVKAPVGLPKEQKQMKVFVNGDGWKREKTVGFMYEPEQGAALPQVAKPDNKLFNWYIQSVTLPVDNLGQKDDRAADGVLYIRDTALEGFRSRMTGDGATSWAAVFNHPACHLLLELRNPQKDVRVLRFKAELVDKSTGQVVPGLCTAAKVNDEAEQGWGGNTGSNTETTAMISLDGKKTQSFILPLYIDYFDALEGDYTLRVTVAGNNQEKVHELPLTIAKKHSVGLIAVGFSFFCLLLVIILMPKIKSCIYNIGARGAITVALFAALAFGGIVLPTTILGDLLHVFLGPFSGLVTGLLSGVLQYLLIMSLLLLFRRPGVLSLMFLVKFMLGGLMFGRFTPLGALSYSVYMVVLEAVLYLCGFYRQKELKPTYMLAVALLMGLADACITFVNLEQMMFFYRLFYADWYIALYMLVNGFVYSSVGTWLGYRTGFRLRQVMGE